MRLPDDNSTVPRGWQLKRVAECCQIRDELRLPLNVQQRAEKQGRFPYYGPTGIVDYLNEYRAEGQFTLIGEDGDHFLKFADWGMTQLVSGKFNVNNHAHILVGMGDCTTEWVYWFLHHRDLRGVLTLQGVGRWKLTQDALRKLPILLPPPDEQRAITKILSIWSDFEVQFRELLKLKRHLKRALMQELLTGRRRFPRFAGATWRECRIGDIAGEVQGRASDPDAPVLSCTKHHGLVDSFEYFGRRVHGEKLEAHKLVRRGEFAYATNHIEEGSIGLLTHRDCGLVSPMYTVFSIKSGVEAEYLFAVLKTEMYRQEFARRTSGSVNRRGGLRWDNFSQIKLSLPSAPEQQKITAVLATADREINLLEQQLAALREQKKGLMQKLLTGQVRVRT
jgi:type I restriction enzyme, S subunit